MKRNMCKQFCATGDGGQLECVDFGCNNYDYDEYTKFCISQLFPNNIHLEIPKRCKPDQIQKLKDIYNDFENNLPFKQIVAKYFKYTNKVENKINICYTNDTCEMVAELIRKQEGYEGEFKEGEHVVNREWLREKKKTFNVNYLYEVVETGSTYKLKEYGTNEIVEISSVKLHKNFISSYACTCHSFQGLSVDGKMTIFDWNMPFVSKKWLWTAITRARDLNNVYFYNGMDAEFTEKQFLKYCMKKIDGYKRQDKGAEREYDPKDYVTVEDIKKCLGTVCPGCTKEFYFSSRGSNITLDREDSDQAHVKSNCSALCFRCNAAKGKKENDF